MSIIKVENLGKKYIIGHDRNAGSAYRYSSLRDTIAHTTRGLYQRLRHPLSPNTENTELEEFWALRHLNFKIQPGDRVGIIGRNGAGKSTLLKILSRITEPTTGRIEIEGRVASLLEVGTGFHPELSGRENIYLNGAILGMSRAEIRGKFDEIIEFAEVTKFLDTPVKRYSSGMYVRLAFAVAAHLNPDILIIDEVLSVGDVAFQKRCLGKLEDVSKSGRTVLFVSHNLGAIQQLCKYCLLFDCGKLVKEGPVRDVTRLYIESTTKHETGTLKGNQNVIEARLVSESPEAVTFGINYDLGPKIVAPPQFAVNIFTPTQIRVCSLVSDYSNHSDVPSVLTGAGSLVCRLSTAPLMPGEYQARFSLWTPGEKVDEIDHHLAFTILPRDNLDIRFDQGHGIVVGGDSWQME